MGCGVCCCKCLLILVNVIVAILGAIILALGAFIKVQGAEMVQPYIDGALSAMPGLPDAFNLQGADSSGGGELTLDVGFILSNISTTLIVIGAFLLGVSILGSIGACCKVKVLLYVYAAIVLALFLVQLIMVILFFTGALDDTIKGELRGTITEEYGGIDAYDTFSLAWNVLMTQLKCCGVDDYKDFTGAKKWDNTRSFSIGGVTVGRTLVTPMACCKFSSSFEPANEACAWSPNDAISNWKTGCYSKLQTEVKSFNTTVVGCIAGILGIQLLCAICAILIGVHLQKKD